MRSVTACLIFFYCVGFIECKPSSPCPSGQFLLKSQCVLCHPTCSECYGHELFECTTCGVDEDGQERFLHQGRCRTHCPRGLYPDRGHYACLPCIANCELCTDGNICAKCREHYKLQNGVCQTASCNTGQVQDPDTGECIDCEMGCKTCSTEDPEICNSCVEGYFLFRHQCRRHCPQSTYEDWGSGVCLSCPAPCTDCRSNTRCLACQPGYFLNGGDCIKQCPPQTFSDSSGWLCQSCHGSCQTCHGPRSTDCNLCLGGNPPLHGQCPLVNCPLGQYFDGKYSECLACDASCKTCFGPQALDCSTCFKGIFLGQDSSCVAQCPSGSYANSATQLCEDCSPNCEACVDTSDNCISCS
ncbi:proprotein convertase subtilisin/kexin type 5-like [Cottoperca gobio]|uniref:Proprotein convertase subtilisin/kexin type 5-like n=1 Tax=Cottoperca gobio TaxID=56716 RepID=A0A6J2PVX8_COTGO|nr:proprotein convertase subtilisin/kexin type 5-like [Cottoperca gobio]